MAPAIEYCPTPAEIQQQCEEFQRGWSYLKRLHALGMTEEDNELESRRPVPSSCFLTVESNSRHISRDIS